MLKTREPDLREWTVTVSPKPLWEGWTCEPSRFIEELGVVDQAHHPITGEAETGGSLGLTGQSA